MKRKNAFNQEDLLLETLEQVGKAGDLMQDLLARLEVELRSYRDRQAQLELALVADSFAAERDPAQVTPLSTSRED